MLTLCGASSLLGALIAPVHRQTVLAQRVQIAPYASLVATPCPTICAEDVVSHGRFFFSSHTAIADDSLPGHAAPPTSSASAPADVVGYANGPAGSRTVGTPRTRSGRPPPTRPAPPAAVAPPFASPPELPAARCDGPPMPSSAPPLPPPLHSPSVAVGPPAVLPVPPVLPAARCDGPSVPSYAPPLPVPPPAHATVGPTAPCVGNRPIALLLRMRRPIPRVAHASTHRSRC